MAQKPCGRGVLVLGSINGNIEIDASSLGFFLMTFYIFGLDPAVDLGPIFTAVPDVHLVDFLGLRVVDDGRARG